MHRVTFAMKLREEKVVETLWKNNSFLICLTLLILLLWAIGLSLFGTEITGLKSQLFGFSILFIGAKLLGCIFGHFRLPPMIGMLLFGVLCRNVDFFEISGGYRKFATVLRQLALVNILLAAGLGLNAKDLAKLLWMILNLATVPVASEIIIFIPLSHYLLNLPWLWATLLGLLLAAVSPAVIIPCLFHLQDEGYGVDKGVHTLVIAASTFNDIICIALYGIVLGVLFSTSTLQMQLLYGPIILAIGFTYGLIAGVICAYVPHQSDAHVVTLRTLLLGFTCILSSLGSDALGYGGSGALGCIVAAFVASLKWRSDGWDNNNPVRMNFILLWKFFEPISFSLIGFEIDFEQLQGDVVLYGTIAMICALLMRIVVSIICTQCTNFNVKEHIFVAICWIPKATVQAALGPVALDMARNLNDPILIDYANTVVIVAVISILLTSPIGAILIVQLGPRFLHKSTQNVDVDVNSASFTETTH